MSRNEGSVLAPPSAADAPRPDGDPAIRARGLRQSFAQGQERAVVLDGVDLDLRSGEVVAVLGPSGSGKSTLLNILGLLRAPESGQYLLEGVSTTELTSTQRAALRLHRVAFVFQSFQLIEHKDVWANVELPLRALGLPRAERAQRIAEVLDRLGLAHRTHAAVTTLSGGEKQRVAIARALVTRPVLLLCDEPTGSLDEQRSQDVIRLLREVTGPEQTTVIVTHDQAIAAQCDRALHIAHGTVRTGTLDGTADGAADGTTPSEEAQAEPEMPGGAAAHGDITEPVTEPLPGPTTRLLADELLGAQPEGGGAQDAPESEEADEDETEDAAPVPGPAAEAFGVARFRSTPWLRTALHEAADAVIHRFRRNLFTILGVALGVASLVLTVGLTATISAQLSDAFDVFASKHVNVTRTDGADLTDAEVLDLAEGAGMRNVRGLNGVEAAALIRPAASGAVTVSASGVSEQDAGARQQRPVLGADPQVLGAQGLSLREGRMFDAGHVQRADRVAVIGQSTLDALGLTFTPGLTVYLAGTPVQVIGVSSENGSLGDDVGAVYVPLSVHLPGENTGAVRASIATANGAAAQVAREAPVALDPAHPRSWSGSVPPEPTTLKDAVDSQQRSLMLVLSLVTLCIAAVGIMNTFLVAVMERRREVGLRLALGSRPLGIMVQFAAESVLTSALGTVLGIVTAINGIAVISLVRHWTPMISPESIGWGVVAGVGVGVLAGLYPAFKASRIDPVDTLTSG